MTDVKTEFRDETYTGAQEVDGNRYVNCTFDNVQLRYAGGPHPEFVDCTFAGANWFFHGAALRTIRLLQMQNYQGYAQAMIDDMFRAGTVFDE